MHVLCAHLCICGSQTFTSCVSVKKSKGLSVTGCVCIAARCELECDVSECSGSSLCPAPRFLLLLPFVPILRLSGHSLSSYSNLSFPPFLSSSSLTSFVLIFVLTLVQVALMSMGLLSNQLKASKGYKYGVIIYISYNSSF